MLSTGCKHLHGRDWEVDVLMLIRRADINATLDITNTLLCDDEWTIIQRRVNGDVNFDRPWDDYAAGFGDVDGSFWLGLQLMHTVTSSGNNQLHIYLESFTEGKIHLRKVTVCTRSLLSATRGHCMYKVTLISNSVAVL